MHSVETMLFILNLDFFPGLWYVVWLSQDARQQQVAQLPPSYAMEGNKRPSSMHCVAKLGDAIAQVH
jgi:hypothetical protein